MNKELTNWFDGFAKVAEASGITDPAEIQKLIAFHKRAELAAKHPNEFKEGYNAQTKQAQELYANPRGYSSEDITPDPAHHATNYGIGGGFLGATTGSALGKLFHTGGPLPAVIPQGKPLPTALRMLRQFVARPGGVRWGILGTVLGALYGANKGRFMQGRYGEGAPTGSPEGYISRMEPEIARMKNLRSRIGGALGAGSKSPHAWYMDTLPQS